MTFVTNLAVVFCCEVVVMVEHRFQLFFYSAKYQHRLELFFLTCKVSTQIGAFLFNLQRYQRDSLVTLAFTNFSTFVVNLKSSTIVTLAEHKLRFQLFFYLENANTHPHTHTHNLKQS